MMTRRLFSLAALAFGLLAFGPLPAHAQSDDFEIRSRPAESELALEWVLRHRDIKPSTDAPVVAFAFATPAGVPLDGVTPARAHRSQHR